jgi:hypothetical protein
MNTLQKQIKKIKLAWLIAAILALPFGAQAQDFQFQFSFKGREWKHSVSAESWKEAIDVASQECLNHFTSSHSNQKVRVDQDTADLLLNTCANPR